MGDFISIHDLFENIRILCLLSLPVGVPTQGNTVKTYVSVRHGRVLMAAIARTWSPVSAALVRQPTSVTPAPPRTAATTTRVVTVVLVTALGCAAVRLATQVVSACQQFRVIFILHSQNLIETQK